MLVYTDPWLTQVIMDAAQSYTTVETSNQPSQTACSSMILHPDKPNMFEPCASDACEKKEFQNESCKIAFCALE